MMEDCLAEFGFDVTGDGSGNGFAAEYPSEQRQAFNDASYICTARYPLLPVFYQPYNEEALNRLYDYFVGESTTCLRERGLLPGEPPTRARFVENYRSTGTLWTPADDLEASTGFEDCLNIPSDLILPADR